jgi:hypothetical protein
MKNFILPLSLLFVSCISCYSQSFSLSCDNGPLVNGTQMVQSGPSDTLQLITSLNITNMSGSAVDVMMKKEEISMCPGASSSICWAGYCYGPGMMVSTFPLSMLPGETVSGCFGHFGPYGCRGVSVIRWTFFNRAVPTDSMSVTVQYSTFPSATETIPDPMFTLAAAGPIPADNQIVIRHTLPPGKQGRIKLRNFSGTTVSSCEAVILSGIVAFNATGLSSGVYYCTLEIDGTTITTIKVLVCHPGR